MKTNKDGFGGSPCISTESVPNAGTMDNTCRVNNTGEFDHMPAQSSSRNSASRSKRVKTKDRSKSRTSPLRSSTKKHNVKRVREQNKEKGDCDDANEDFLSKRNADRVERLNELNRNDRHWRDCLAPSVLCENNELFSNHVMLFRGKGWFQTSTAIAGAMLTNEEAFSYVSGVTDGIANLSGRRVELQSGQVPIGHLQRSEREDEQGIDHQQCGGAHRNQSREKECTEKTGEATGLFVKAKDGANETEKRLLAAARPVELNARTLFPSVSYSMHQSSNEPPALSPLSAALASANTRRDCGNVHILNVGGACWALDTLVELQGKKSMDRGSRSSNCGQNRESRDLWVACSARGDHEKFQVRCDLFPSFLEGHSIQLLVSACSTCLPKIHLLPNFRQCSL